MTYFDLYHAYRAFRRGKRPSRDLIDFEYALESNLLGLLDAINHHTYRHGAYKTLDVTEKKRRRLAIASIRDRVVHRLVYDYLVQRLDKTLDPDVFSARRGKGLHKALTRTQNLLRRHPHSFIWRLDIHKFYDCVDNGILKTILLGKFPVSLIPEEAEYLYLSFEIIDSHPAGIPLGNLTSQIFANLYLNEFDRYVRHSLKPQAYIRYGDDMLLFAPNRQATLRFQRQGSRYLAENLKLCLNPINNLIIPADQPLHFLGHVITKTYTVVDKHTTRSSLNKLNLSNAASYKSLNLAKVPKSLVDWILFDQIAEIIV